MTIHNDYPLVAEKINVNKNMLSNYCETIRQKYNITISQVQKLIPTSNNELIWKRILQTYE